MLSLLDSIPMLKYSTKILFLIWNLSFISGYASGLGSIKLPANIGIPFGNTSDPYDLTYLAIEIHYNNDNPSQPINISDTTGISLTYTTTKREHDAGVIG